MNYTIENVTTKEQLNKLYGNSAFTIEGLADDSIPDLINWLEENTVFTTDNPIVYVTKGRVMNTEYLLTDNKAYQEDLTIVSVIDIDSLKIALKRFSVGGRWFDDIVDNNAR
jgi:5'(3')-deoxyribonucleotidase